MEKQPTLKQTAMAFAIIVALVLYAMNFINWRDALLIIAAPVAIYHLIFVYIFLVSKPADKPLSGPPPGIKYMEPRFQIKNIDWKFMKSKYELQQMRRPYSKNELFEIAALEIAQIVQKQPELLELIESEDYEDGFFHYHFKLRVLLPKKNQYV